MKQTAWVAVATLVLVACQERGPTQPTEEAAFAISDGVAEGGNPDFFFLPPLVPNPTTQPDFDHGEFNPNLAPRVEICEVDDAVGACAPTQGSGFPIVFPFAGDQNATTTTVSVDVNGEKYKVLWDTKAFDLDPQTTYRIRSFVGTIELGFADVDVVKSGSELKNVNTNEYIPVKNGRTLPIHFRIENGAFCEPGAVACVSKTLDLSEGGDVVLPGGDRLDVPAQDGEDDQVTFTVQPCVRFDELPIDLPKFGACLDIDANPSMSDPLVVPATISVCGDLDLGGISEEQEHLVTLHRRDIETGAVEALPHVADNCETIVGGAAPHGWTRLARVGWNAMRSGLATLVGPRPLHAAARRRFYLDRGRGGATSVFSSFQFALPAQMEILEGDGQNGEPGAEVGIAPAVRITDAHGDPVEGARVAFSIPADGGNGSVVPPSPARVLSDADGVARADSWTLGTDVATHLLTATGVGIADPTHDGPFIPDLSLDPQDQTRVLLETGSVTFTAQTWSAEIVGGVRAPRGRIAGATVTLGGDASAQTTTDSDGAYSFPNLPPGDYTVTLTDPQPGILLFSELAANVHIKKDGMIVRRDFDAILERFFDAAEFMGTLGQAKVSQDFESIDVGTSVSSIVPNFLDVTSSFAKLEVVEEEGDRRLFGWDETTRTAGAGRYDVTVVGPAANAIAFDAEGQDPSAGPIQVVIDTKWGPITVWVDGDGTEPTFVGIITRPSINSVAIVEGLQMDGTNDAVALDDFTLAQIHLGT